MATKKAKAVARGASKQEVTSVLVADLVAERNYYRGRAETMETAAREANAVLARRNAELDAAGIARDKALGQLRALRAELIGYPARWVGMDGVKP